MEALGALGLALLLGNVAAHLALVFAIGRKNAPRGAVAFFLPPLSVAWGWAAGARKPAIAWGATLAAFALDVVVIRFLR